MLKFAKLLNHKGFHITFVNTEFNQNRLLKSRGASSLNVVPSFRFESIPDGLPPSLDPDATQDVSSLCQASANYFLEPFRHLLKKLNTSPKDVPSVTCIISDSVMSFTLDAAEEIGVPDVLFWTASACSYLGYMHYEQLIDKGYVPLKHPSDITNGDLETMIDWIPDLKNIRLRDLPSFLRTTDPNDIILLFVIYEWRRSKRASAFIFNTYDALEKDALEALSSLLPPIYTIGPLQLLNQEIISDQNLKSIQSNLLKEDSYCLEWLDSKEPNSVVFVNFGSIAVMSYEQLVQFAWGLADSEKPFLWVIRPDLIIGKTAIVPSEFLEVTKGANWCPQEQVICHVAIGGFLTHNGWNPTLESVCGGVPLISWPFFADQQTNCKYCSDEWGIGLEIEGETVRGKIDRLIRNLMDGEKGKELKKKTLEWKKLAEDATIGPNA